MCLSPHGKVPKPWGTGFVLFFAKGPRSALHAHVGCGHPTVPCQTRDVPAHSHQPSASLLLSLLVKSRVETSGVTFSSEHSPRDSLLRILLSQRERFVLVLTTSMHRARKFQISGESSQTQERSLRAPTRPGISGFCSIASFHFQKGFFRLQVEIFPNNG